MPGDMNLTVRIPSELKHEVEMEAARDNRSKAQIVIIALRHYLDSIPQPKRTIPHT